MADGLTPGPVLAGALNFVDSQVGSFVKEIHTQCLNGNTTIILSAMHGQSPTAPAALTRIPDGPLLAGLNAAWKQPTPAPVTSSRTPATTTPCWGGTVSGRGPGRAAAQAVLRGPISG